MAPLRYVFVTGGVLSGVGKGVVASAVALLLRAHGLAVSCIKIDPYLNVDSGTMSPFEHGEVFVLDDGSEVDLDLGNYERFVGLTLRGDNNITTGKVYRTVIERERRGEFLGKTVQIIPHVTDEIQDWIERVARIPLDTPRDHHESRWRGADAAPAAHHRDVAVAAARGDPTPDFCVIEVGGTVGDIEGQPFTEAIRQFHLRVGKDNIFLIHVSLVPQIGVNDEHKTKPTQNTIKELRSLGLSPDIVVCRSRTELPADVRRKVAMFSNVPPECVLSVPDIPNVYHVPSVLRAQGLEGHLFRRMNLVSPVPIAVADLSDWERMATSQDQLSGGREGVHIALVGKYTDLHDCYLSVTNALRHAAMELSEVVVIDWIESSALESPASASETSRLAWETVEKCTGVLIPGGFGIRGIDGMLAAARHARESRTPFLGICLGMQVAVIEVCRNVLGESANSTEFDESCEYPAVIFMPSSSPTRLGGTMCLGRQRTTFIAGSEGSLCRRLYGGAEWVEERHRHRYEINPDLAADMESRSDLRFISRDASGRRLEIVEFGGHPFYLGTQFHPEFRSRPLDPSPCFAGFVAAACGQLDAVLAARPHRGAAPATPPAESGTSRTHSVGELGETNNAAQDRQQQPAEAPARKRARK